MSGDIGDDLGQRVAAVVSAAFGVACTIEDAVVRPSQREGVDYQVNAAMALAKRLRRSSREVADVIAANLDLGGMAESAEVAGPGFINITLSTAWLADRTARLAADPRLGYAPASEPQRVIIDYSSPNMAKEMHVGHLRSTIIGDTLVRLTEFAGHEVIRQNHIGDWGTPFGMLVEHLIDEGLAEQDFSIGDLNVFYQQARTKFDADEDFAERARMRVVALQAGDPATLELWGRLLTESKHHIEAVYELLGVRLSPDDYKGESTYQPWLDDVADELRRRGIAEDSDGALCVFLDGFTGREDQPVPLIVRKRDGGFGYDATDLATIRYRAQDLKGDHLVYVVGAPQALHFAMIFAAARKAEWISPETVATHVGFGSVLGADGRMLRTRAGASLKLTDLLDEAVERAAGLIAGRGELSEEERTRIARAVGIGAVKYADLSVDRDKDYVFDLDRMLAMDGNTAVYLQYAHARIRSILRRADRVPELGAPVLLAESAERDLALKLARFPDAVQTAITNLQPHRLCTYLFELAAAFSTFYENCPVLKSEGATRESRLALALHTATVLERGLDLLGIEAPERL
ncbi:arginine--tRNA ligase [Actinorugispora endophytica]|uniref:Arginine--tRNA ligase n=1 Tax=Actinorugispora endophytica TaxID=1605990 RepID=A0A4R6V490_9ACTN|nr:arginine--tRNA ligase [Actinorugispora endophytica]TDQ55225.1 arginyl-tRNA synthetase [Actinorugispora endophytica]